MSVLTRIACLFGLGWFGLIAAPAGAEPFSFVVVGDQPYGNSATTKTVYQSLIGAINATAPAIVIHVGDTKSGGTLCSDSVLAERHTFLNEFEAATLYTPGDNEWTDCHRLITGKYDPEERLSHIRATYFAVPEQSFGQNPIALHSQVDDGFPENARTMIGGVMFVTAHVVGSNNSFEGTRPDAAAEYAARDAANRKWLEESFAAAQDSKALVLAIHANMFSQGFGTKKDPEGFHRFSGYRRFAQSLIWQAGKYGKPVLLVHGDGHRFGMLRPFPMKAPNIIALQTFGGNHMHAVQVHVRPDDAYPFAFQPLPNPDQPMRLR